VRESHTSNDPNAGPGARRGWQRRHRAALIATSLCSLLGLGAVVGLAALAGSSHGRPSAQAAPPTTAEGPQVTTTQPHAAPHARPAPPGSTVVAHMKGTFLGYSRPGGVAKVLVTKTWETMPSTLPVIGTAPGGWLQVRVPERPDQSTAWIRASDAVLGTTPYRILVNLKTTHLQLYKLNRLVANFPAGVGAPGTPTPLGDYFVAFLEPPISSGYGAFIIITSAHSQAIQSWDGTGDAIIGIHGPIDAYADAEIGTTGAYISNGCVRLHDNDLLRLEDVPPGTPISIID
jgi:lipoprotein-anchoring transpeptidase ErfK/SrfK